MSAAPAKPHRGTIFLEDATLLTQEAWPDEQYVCRLSAPKCASHATPGSFVHVRCADDLPMRRPLSIQRVDREAGWIEILYKVVGKGLARLAQARPGDSLSCLGPIGQGFSVNATRPRRVLIGGGVGIPPMVFLAEHLRDLPGQRPVVFMGSEIPFPFRERPSTLLLPGLPPDTIATMPLLDDWGIPCRLATKQGYPGCFDGFVTELAATWLAALPETALKETEIFACGPTPMLRAVAAVAARFGVPAQVSLEEFMACAVGGCAGCAVRVETPTGPAMKRVCVDGPVFEARSVFPEQYS
jgi:dihydroorotate dehydrogenase electron transfer subunit